MNLKNINLKEIIIKQKKWIAIGTAAVIVASVLLVRVQSSAKQGYSQDVAALRDIQTFHSFTGTITPVTQRSVTSAVSGVEVVEVLVEKGDDVKAGDVIARLNTDSVEEQILEKEASIESTDSQNALSLESAQKSYDNLKSDVAAGLNSSILSAQSSMDSAFSSLLSAQKAYNDEVSLNNQQLSSTILNAIQSVDSAYQKVQSAALSQEQAKESREHYEDTAGYDSFSYDQQIDSADLSEEQAWANYNAALRSYEAAKQNEESSLTKLYDSMLTAQNSYLVAIDNYNAAVRSVNQQLENYELQIRQAQASANSELSELQLADLQNSLDKYTITAPIDGVVTELNVKEGDMATVGNIATITDFSELKVDIKIGEYDVLGASIGSPVTITVDALGHEYEGTIKNIDRTATVEGNVSYFGAEVRFAADDEVRSGMSAEARLQTNDVKGAVSILNDAIQTDSDGTAFVMAAGANGRDMEKRAVSCGATDGVYTEILEGLNEGETVYYTPSGGGFSMEQGGGNPFDN